jgi:hypothetical protein
MAAPAAKPAPMLFLKKSLRFICLMFNSISPKFTISPVEFSSGCPVFQLNFDRF